MQPWVFIFSFTLTLLLADAVPTTQGPKPEIGHTTSGWKHHSKHSDSSDIKCDGTVNVLSNSHGIIRSEDFLLTGDGSEKYDCNARIEGPEGSIVRMVLLSLEMHCNYDFLSIYSGKDSKGKSMGPHRICNVGALAENPLLTSSSSAFIHFRKESPKHVGGFSLMYEVYKPGTGKPVLHSSKKPHPEKKDIEVEKRHRRSVEEQSCSEGTVILTSAISVLPPDDYVKDPFHCVYRYIADDDKQVELIVISANFNGSSDGKCENYMSVYNGFPATEANRLNTYCQAHGVINNLFLSTAGSLTLVISGPLLGSDQYAYVVSKYVENEVKLGGMSGEFKSPGYPNNYPPSRNAEWTIEAPIGHKIELSFEYFNIEFIEGCYYDALRVFVIEDGRPVLKVVRCGDNFPTMTFNSSQINVQFETDSSLQKKGFHAHYKIIRQEDAKQLECGYSRFNPLNQGEDGSMFMARIIGGRNTDPKEWPWQISIQRYGSHFCGGSVISDEWILSAAHCFDSTKPFKVIVGAYNISKDEGNAKEFTAEKVVCSPDYNSSTINNDVCLVKLSAPLEFNDYIRPVCLPEKNTFPTDSEVQCYVTGWGSTIASGGYKGAKVLQEVTVPLISRETCNKETWYNGNIKDTMFCAGYPQGTMDSCQGDSGGPLVCYDKEKDRFFQNGIVSWGAGCAQAQKPGVYARVDHSVIRDFIKKHTGV